MTAEVQYFPVMSIYSKMGSVLSIEHLFIWFAGGVDGTKTISSDADDDDDEVPGNVHKITGLI